jgi:hypothetical protein
MRAHNLTKKDKNRILHWERNGEKFYTVSKGIIFTEAFSADSATTRFWVTGFDWDITRIYLPPSSRLYVICSCC